MLLFYTTYSDVSGSHNHDDIVGWTWSENISKGSTYYWNVTKFREDNIPVTSISNNVLNLVEGSIISVTIKDNLQKIDYLRVITVTGGDLPIEIQIDGKQLKNQGTLGAEFVYPNMIVWKNGTLTNLFYMDIPAYNHQFQFSPYGSIDQNEYVINIEKPGYQQIIARDIETGLLTKWYLQIDNAILTYDPLKQYEGVYKVDNLSTLVNTFNFSFFLLKSIVIILPLMLYIYSKNRYFRL